MKSFRLTLALCVASAVTSSCFARAQAQALAAALPLLEVSSRSLPENGAVTLRLPVGAALPAKRVIVALYEWNRKTPAAQIWKVPELREGRWQTSVTVNADPGFYQFRWLTIDKVPRPLTAVSEEAHLEVPGIARVPGWWLPMGAPFLFLPEAGTVSPPDAPLFVPGLQRKLGSPAQTSSATNAVANHTPAWRTMPLPPLREMLATGYDWTALKSDLGKRLGEAQNRGERGFWGWSLLPGQGRAPLSGAREAIMQLRTILNDVSPGAALILDVEATRDVVQAARDVDGAAAFCDAVLLRVPDNQSAFWAVKTARRVAEEQPGYDLPILVQVQNSTTPSTNSALSFYAMSGATGFVLERNAVKADTEKFLAQLSREASLWIGSVTLEDTGVLPPPDAPDAVDDESLLNFVEQLRAIGRVPLLARANPIGAPESLMLRLGSRISGATIDRLEKLVRAGARLYIEGAPTADENGKALPWRLTTLVGADVTAMPARRTNLVLDDPWVFGSGRGTRLPVEQTFTIQLQMPSMASQANAKKGVLTQVGPRTAATLEDGSPGLIINVLGKGEVVWMPHRPLKGEASIVTSQNGVPTVAAPGLTPPGVSRAGSTPNVAQSGATQSGAGWAKYLSGVADYVAPRLVQQRAPEGVVRGSVEGLQASLRRSPKGTLLLLVEKKATLPGAFKANVTVEGAHEAASVLNTEAETFLPTTTRGLQTTFPVEIERSLFVALSDTKQALEAERNAPRAKAKLR